MEEDDLPSIDTIVKGFKIIENSPLETLSYSEIKQLFENALGIIPKMVVPNAALDPTLYRVTNGLFSGFDKNKISYFSHPPAEYCKKGRANLSGFPVFYASLTGDTALREFRNEANEPIKDGDIVYISEWKIKKGIKVSYTQFIYDEAVKLDGRIIDINISNQEKLAKIFSTYSTEKQKAFKILIEKLGNLYILDKTYFASSFLSHYLLYEDRSNSSFLINVLIYPSVQAGFKGINYAFHPEFVKEYIELKLVRKIVFNNFEDGGATSVLLELGIPKKNGIIKWHTIILDINSIKKTNKNILLFNNTPPDEDLVGDIKFYSKINEKHYGFGDLITLGWSRLKENSNDLFSELVKIEGNIGHNKTYKKLISVDISNEEIFINLKDIRYDLKAIAFEIKYKFRLEELA